MRRLHACLAMALLMGTALPAPAHFGFMSRARLATAYYFPVPTVPVPVYVMPPSVCMPAVAPIVAPRLLAQPQPAPASTGKEPPVAVQEKPGATKVPAGPPVPGVTESRKSNFYESYAVAPGGSAKSAAGRCSVSFWNLSPQEFVLKVGDQRLTLGPGRSATLDLEQQFTWQIEGRESQTSRVAQQGSALEIVIRR